MRARKLITAFAAVPLILASAVGAAHADVINDDAADTLTAEEALSLEAGSSTGVVGKIKLVGTGGDGDAGCNIDAGEGALVLDLVTPAGVTASPNPLSITECGVDSSVVFKADETATSGVVIASIVSRPAGGGTFNNTVKIAINVTQPAPTNTTPSITISGVTAGASYEIGSEPSPVCNITDTEDGNSTKAATVSPSQLPHGLGSLTATCDYTDKGGQAADTVTATYTIVDRGTPTINHELISEGVENENGWYNKDVTVTFTCADPRGSGIQSCLAGEGPGSSTILGEGEDQSVTGTATDWAGNTATDTASGIDIDKTRPTVSSNGVVEGTLGTDGWYRTDVTVEFKGVDTLSGLAEDTQRVTSSGEGAAIVVSSPAFTDLAGNTTAAGSAAPTVKVDKTAPTDVSFVGGPAEDVEYYENLVPAAPTCTADDTLSGLATCEVTGYSKTVGTQILVATAIDKAGNETTLSRSYKVRPNLVLRGFYAPVDKGIFNTVKAGSTVPLKFEVFDGTVEQRELSKVKGFTTKVVSCQSGLGEDAVEELAASTSSNGLRYDTTGDQYIYNWKTSGKAGTCYEVKMTTEDDSSITALFKLK